MRCVCGTNIPEGYSRCSCGRYTLVPDRAAFIYTFQYGKYKGKTILETIEYDWEYVQWCGKNLSDPLMKRRCRSALNAYLRGER